MSQGIRWDSMRKSPLAGLLLSILVLVVVVSSFAGYEFKLKEVLILSAVLAILSVLAFVKGLGLPFPLWPAFLT